MVKVGIIGCKPTMDICVQVARSVSKLQVSETAVLVFLTNLLRFFLTSCGGCPGIIPAKMDLVNRILDTLDLMVDAVYLGTCVQRAIENFDCPMDPGFVKDSLEKTGAKVYVGTHAYPLYTKK